MPIKCPHDSQVGLNAASGHQKHTFAMSANRVLLHGRFTWIRRVAVTGGLGAIATACVLTASQSNDGPTTVEMSVAGSGSAPVNTSYTQPVEGDMTAMNTGATVMDTTTPPTTLPTSKAVPAIKAGH